MMYNHIYNNTKTKLIEYLYKEIDMLSNNTECERTLSRYFYHKLEDVYKSYDYIKTTQNWAILYNDTFNTQFLGNGKVELGNVYKYFPLELLDKINEINLGDYEQFKKDIQTELLKTKDREVLLGLLKVHTLSSFRRNVRKIYKLYLDTRHLINDPEYIKQYPELFKDRNLAIIRKTEHTDYIKFDNKMSLKKDKVEELIQKGRDGLKEALAFLYIFSIETNETYTSEIIMLQGRLSDHEKLVRTGQEAPLEELNRITNSTLEILNKF